MKDSTGATITLSDPGGGSVQAFTYDLSNQVVSFNPVSGVNAVADTITVPAGNSLTDGEPVTYHVDPTKSTTQGMPVQNTISFELNGINAAQHSIVIPNNGFATGDTVTFSANGNAPISGLTDGASYTVETIDFDNFMLLDSNRNVIPIMPGATGTFTFDNGVYDPSVTLASITPDTDVITLAGHGLTSGQTVIYNDPDPNTVITGLADGTQVTRSTSCHPARSRSTP